MEGIYYKEGIYFLVDSDKKHDNCVYHYNNRDSITLLGGRAHIYYCSETTAYLTIDGIRIINIYPNRDDFELTLSQVTSHLNAIETNGLDAFLQNYKQSVEFFYDELKNICQMKTEQLASTQDDKKIKTLLSELEKLNKQLLLVLPLLFILKANMLAGLENEKVVSVYQSIMDSLL